MLFFPSTCFIHDLIAQILLDFSFVVAMTMTMIPSFVVATNQLTNQLTEYHVREFR